MKKFLQEYLENNKVDVPIEARLEDGTTYTSIVSYFNYNGDYFNISDINTSNVNNMSNMFYGCKSLNKLNLSNFNT